MKKIGGSAYVDACRSQKREIEDMPKASEYTRLKRILKKIDERIDRASKEGDQARGFRAIGRRTALELRGLKGPALNRLTPVSAYF